MADRGERCLMQQRPVIILGAGGHARVTADIVRQAGGQVLAFSEISPTRARLDDLPVIEEEKALGYRDSAQYLIAIGDNGLRHTLAERLDLCWYTAVHPSAQVSAWARIGEGTVVMPGAVVNAGASVGRHCILNTHCVVEHDCVLEDYVHLSPGALLGGTVLVGEETHIGIGAAVRNNLRICARTVVGAGAVVVKEITQEGVYCGVPATRLK